MGDSTLKLPGAAAAPLKPPAVAALSVSSLQLPSSAPQKLTSAASNGNVSGSATGNPRNKCALKPGYSLMSWIRLCNSGADLSGTAGRVVPVSRTELARHNQVNDAWMAIRGKVFNVTRYMDYHPGGVDELMRGVGRDATKLFDEVHAWVNYPQLLGKCYVGPLKDTVASKKATDAELLRLPPPSAPAELKPRFDWIQQRRELTLYFYTRRWANPGVLLKRKTAEELEVRVQLAEIWHLYNFKLHSGIIWPPKALRVSPETGKIELVLSKQEEQPWSSYGSHEASKTSGAPEEELLDFMVQHCSHFNHDSFELCLESVEQELLLHLPVGYHLDIEVPHNGERVQRSYTPVPHNCLLAEAYSSSSSPNSQRFLIKHYENGIVSSQLNQLESGGNLQLTLPRGNFNLAQLEAHRHILLLAAGSGLTPMLSLLRPLLERHTNRIERLQLLYFNKTQADIWWKDKLLALQSSDERFLCQHILSQEVEEQPPTPNQNTRICPELLAPLFEQQQPLGERFSYVAICGPTGFNTAALDSLRRLEFKLTNVHVFQG
ncbi:cytochrome b5 reductase 4 [Drosophila grimshawi]|uniref:GH22815 n=1 Tax=Drosophila grimshawi TaxID=7222 RepID=B4JW45_DROGR|nr:cytochrome b5 reductase 4 [Drosophila grimshawi]EDV98183.1 GH22815 [Drosophila grimshawi]